MSLHMKDWQQRRKGGGHEASGGGSEGGISLPLGPGEWDETLGLPLCVVCHSVSIRVPGYAAIQRKTLQRMIEAKILIFRPIKSKGWKKIWDGARKSLILSCNFSGRHS